MKKIIFKIKHFTKGEKKASVMAISWLIICFILGISGNRVSYKLSKKTSYGKYLLLSTCIGILLYIVAFFGGSLIASKIKKDLANERKARSEEKKYEKEITIDNLEED